MPGDPSEKPSLDGYGSLSEKRRAAVAPSVAAILDEPS